MIRYSSKMEFLLLSFIEKILTFDRRTEHYINDWMTD